MLYLIPILFIAFLLRSYGINWDQGFHLHPDERALIMVTEHIHFFDRLNPDFFNYGSLPIYLLRGVSQLLDHLFSTQFSSYQGMLYVGRYLSIFFDLVTILLIYKTANLLFSASSNTNEGKLRAKSRSLNYRIALFSSFFYAIAFFPIQNSHFFVVDVFLTFFITLLLFFLLKYITLPSRHDRGKNTHLYSLIIPMVFAAMLATKFTAIIFLPVISLSLIFKNRGNLKKCIFALSIFYLLSSIFFFIFMPYAFLEYQRLLSDITAQIKMNSDPYIFPYTLQYVGTLPYLYYLKNIFFWGLGPITSILSLIGLLNLIFTSQLSASWRIARRIIKLLFERSREQSNKITINNQQLTIFFLFNIFYFLIIGRSAVKFMRYMLPMYPFLTIMAGFGFYKIYSFFCHPELARPSKSEGRSGISGSETRCRNKFGMTILILIFISTTIWTSMFLNIYSQKHTRIAATEWILKNIPKDSTIALEHWDDGLPLTGGENYNHVELTLYDQPDDDKKWLALTEKLKVSDYIIIASNRLYVPLQKLADCEKYKSCYPKTAEYYRKLFAGENVILASEERTRPESNNDPDLVGMTEVKFRKVAEFSVYPKISINNYQLTINDDSADESFTVYDHPKIMIFKKI